jgi:hypothetical protein
MERWEVAVVHAFKGKRFDDGHLDVDVAPELKAYRDLVVEVAKSLWQRENSDRQRLPRQFDRKFQLRLSALSKGSAVATLSRNAPAKVQLDLLGGDDVFARAMRLVEGSVKAASKAEALPAEFPRTALARFRRWGDSLSDDERIEIRTPGGETLATYDSATRASLLDRIDTSYEDEADEIGYVLATSIRAGRFELYRTLDSGEGVVVPLNPEYEEKVLKALQQHDEVRLRVKGTGAFAADGALVRFTRVVQVNELDQEVSNASLWSRLEALTASVPEEAWDVLSPDSAERHDAYL